MDTLLEKQLEYIENLSEHHIHALRNYTGSGYEILNKKMRNEEPLSIEEKSLLKRLDEIFREAPDVKEDLYLYRGIKEEFNPSLSSFMSCSLSEEIARDSDFSGYKGNSSVLRIKVSKGSKVLPLFNVSFAKYEKEILLDRYGKCEIISKGYDIFFSKKTYEVKYIPFSDLSKPLVVNFGPITYNI